MTRRLPRLDKAMIRPPDVMIREASWARIRSARAFVAITQSHCLGERSRPSRSTPDAALLTSPTRWPARPTAASLRDPGRRTRSASRPLSSGSGSEPPGGRELADDVLGDRTDRQPAHDDFHGLRRVQVLLEVVGELIDAEPRQVERRRR